MYIRGVAEAEAQGPVADYYESQRTMWGFLPNYAAAFSHRPEVAQAWAGLNLAIRGGMDRRRYELATIAAARARRSTYCTVAHSMFLRDVCGDEDAVRSIVGSPDGAALADQDRAVYEFAILVATNAADVTAEDVQRLRVVGLSDADIADVVFAVSARLFFATVLDGLGAELDPETAGTFGPELLDSMIVGRPVAARTAHSTGGTRAADPSAGHFRRASPRNVPQRCTCSPCIRPGGGRPLMACN